MLEIITTADGSSSLYHPDLNETYHSRNGALAESMHVYIDAGFSYLLQRGEKAVNIFEMGFGTGLNTALTYKQWIHNKNVLVNYTTIEKYPVPIEIAVQLKYDGITDEPEISKAYVEMHQSAWGSWFNLATGFNVIKVEEDITQYHHKGHYNLVYFDAFAPSKQAEVWQTKILESLVAAMDRGGVLVTYCAKGEFKRTLKALGLQVEALPGPTGKKQITRAHK